MDSEIKEVDLSNILVWQNEKIVIDKQICAGNNLKVNLSFNDKLVTLSNYEKYQYHFTGQIIKSTKVGDYTLIVTDDP